MSRNKYKISVSEGTPILVQNECTFEGTTSIDSKYANLRGIVEKVGPANLIAVRFNNKKVGLVWRWNLLNPSKKVKNASSKTK